MPKIFNTSWVAVIVATIAFFALGAVWYTLLFSDAWAAATGITAERSEALMADMGMAAWLFWALLITFGQAIGLLMVIHLAGATRLGTSLKYAALLVLTIVAPVLAYANIYQGYSLNGFLIDFGHLLIGYVLMAAIYAAFRSRDSN